MNSIRVLDVTLRDGGCVNDFNFGQAYMNKILSGLEQSGVDIIELGYIDTNNGSAEGRTKFCDEKVITKHFLHTKKPGTTYVAMFDFGKFDPDNLQPYTSNGIDGLRIAFHKKDRFNMIPFARKVLEKGYQVFIQPMTIMRYTDSELLEFIDTVNRELPEASAFYIVDSFGEMRMDDLKRLMHLVDHNLLPQIPMGFHSHNNLQLSYSNAVTLLQFFTQREIIIDSAILGMGKGAGNLNTELFVEHLNLYYQKQYRIAPLLEVIDKVLNTLRAEYYWGYSIEYYLSSINHCTPSYAAHFYKKHMLGVDQVAELLGMISEDKKVSFDKDYAEQLYLEYNARNIGNDDAAVSALKARIAGHSVLVIAPGKSSASAQKLAEPLLNDNETISVSLNAFDLYETDYVLTTRSDAFEAASKAQKNIIVTSGVCNISDAANISVIDYKKWIEIDDGVHDSSGVIALKLLKACGAKELLLVGFDGFTVDINQNYYDMTMRNPVAESQAIKRNTYFSKFIQQLRESVPVRFLTPSLYEK